MMLRMIMTKKQISQRQSFQPIEYTNININKRDFIYATSVGGEKTAPVAKINPAGSNILNSQIKYGDDKNSSKHYFTGIVEDKDEFFYVADNQTGLIFQYDQKSDLIAAFGGIGDRLGLFQNPIDIDIAGDRLLVLDSEKENLTIFIPTEYQKQISEALNYYKLGKYSQSIVPWQKVLQLNTNFATAYVGIGNALYMKGEFRQAMNYFELGNEKELYSRAKQANRTQVLIKNFTSLMISVILLIILLSLLSKNRIKVKTWIRKKLNTKNNFGG
jgi:tetratricopeptide (TPR) repeat protein